MGLAMQICKALSLVQVDPKSFRRTTSIHVHDTKRVYRVSAHAAQRSNCGALVDRGANGGIIGNDAHILFTHPGQEVDVTGIDNHQIGSLKVVDACTKIFTQRGEPIGMFRQYAYHGKVSDLLKGQSNRAVIWIKKLTDYSCITAVMTDFLTYYYSLLTNYLVITIPLLLITVHY